MTQRRYKQLSLRILAAGLLGSILLVFLLTVIFVDRRMSDQKEFSASNGFLSLTHQGVYEEPVHLNGQWDAFPGVVCTTPQQVQTLGPAPAQVELPMGSIVQARQSATYRLRFSLPQGDATPLLLYIPNSYQSVDVYLNGIHLDYLQDGTPWLPLSAMESMLPLTPMDTADGWQELVLTGDFADQSNTLYKRSIIIGTQKNLSALALFSSSNEMFLCGLLMLILVNGYVFMLFRPGHKIISLMTLFDTMVLLRTALSMPYVMAFLKEIFPFLPVGDRLLSSLSLLFLMLGGIVGCKLSAALYDPEGKAPQWLVAPMPWIYGIFAVIFPLFPHFFEQVGRYLLIPTYALTFVGVAQQSQVYWAKGERRVYGLLQMIKTIYIGALIFWDILFWTRGTSSLLLSYLYSVFFLLHVVVRLYDNNESYRDVEVLNASLEDTVRQRTRELSDANRVLAELSIKDPLTQIFNRLYFERTMENVLSAFRPDRPVHLCIFDLDFFKRINDTYGHGAGDEQLRALSALVGQLLGHEAIFARFGGEEFVLLFQGPSQQEVLVQLEQVRHAIAEDARRESKHTTASFGVAAFVPGDTPKTLMKRADMALYEAKRLGRDQVVVNVGDALTPAEELMEVPATQTI